MTLKKKIIAIGVGIIVVIIAIGCIGRVSKPSLKQESNVRKTEQQKGIYYSALNPKEIGLKYDKMAQYGYSSLLYRNKIYTCDIRNEKQYSEKELSKEKYELIRQKNLYEYGVDIINNTERLSLNKNILSKHYYIINR